MTQNCLSIEPKHTSPGEIYQVIPFISPPFGLYQVRVLCGNGEDQIQYRQPIVAGVDLIIIEKGLHLIREGNLADDGKCRMNGIDIALVKCICGVLGWNLEGVDLIRDEHIKIIAMVR